MDFGSLFNSAITAYGTYAQQQAQDKYYDTMRQAEQDKNQYYNDQAVYDYESKVAALMAGGGGSGGGGGGGSPKMTSEMLQMYKDYMSKAEAMRQPYIDAGKSVLPQRTEAYKQGLGVSSKLAEMYSSPEALQRMNQNVPAYNIAFNIPRVK